MPAIPAPRVLENLARTPASDMKKLGWRGVMSTVQREGAVVVTNHDRPEAIVLSVEAYDDLLQDALQARAQKQAVLEQLRHEYDKRLSVLNTPEAGETLRNILRRPIDFKGQVLAGDEF